ADKLELKPEPGRLSLYTSQATVRRSQNHARMVGVLSMVAGSALLWHSILGWIVIAFGIIAFAAAPRCLRAEKLLELDTVENTLIPAQSAAGARVAVPVDHIRYIRGVYDTKGWDGFSVVYAVETDGTQTPV